MTDNLAPLRALLVLLREHGVTEYSSGDIALKLGPARADKPATDAAPATAEPVVTLRQAAETISPVLAEAVDRLPAGYAKFFTGSSQ